jgi:hypothetical protein
MSLRYGLLSAHASVCGHMQAAYSLCCPFCLKCQGCMTPPKKRLGTQWRVLSSGIEHGLVRWKLGSNPTQGMDICLRLFCVFVCSGLSTGWFPVKGVLSTVLGLRNWSETKRFTDALHSKVGATRKREKESVESQPTFRRNKSHPSLGLNKRSKEPKGNYV